MNWQIICLIVVAIIFLIIFFPLFLQLRFYVNLLENLGAVSISLFGIVPLFAFRFNIQKDALRIISKKQKEKDLKFFAPNAYFVMKFLKLVLQKLLIFEITLFAGCGKKQDAMTLAMLSGVLISAVHILFAILSTQKNFEASFVCDKNFENDELKFSGFVSIFILPFTILICLMKALKISQKRERKWKETKC